MDYIISAIPVFLLLMGMELVFSVARRKHFYRGQDTLANLSCGILSELFAALIKGTFLLGYATLYENVAPFHLSTHSAFAWTFAFFGVDIAYYWAHRASHRIEAAWAAHSVHHQSEEYNFSVALRQSSFQPLFTWIFFLPLAVLGLPPSLYVLSYSLNLLYQFWIHTRFIGSLGPLEWALNTPSHHRVHHGRNPKYLDKNYAGVLIIWDRFFGTFQPEEEEPLYGVTKPLGSWNPIWANFQVWVDTARRAREFPTLRCKLLVWIKPPGWAPDLTMPPVFSMD